jgi:phage terminase large subunit
MNQQTIQIPEKLIPVFMGKADVRGSYGGRGSAKTRSFAKMSALKAFQWSQAGTEGIILCARQHLNSLDDSSMEEIKLAIRSEHWLEEYFDIGEKYIRTKDGRIRYVFSGLDRNVASVKSKSRILLCWVDEAEPVVESAWITLIPTIREEDSELWVTWNPERDGSPCDLRFRKEIDPLIKVVEMNHRDNEKFPSKLERQRVRDFSNKPDDYDHIWEGGYKTHVEGAYFAKQLSLAKSENRIGMVKPDELLTFRVYIDIGGTGARSDAFTMWPSQIVGLELRVLDYYETVGQPISSHLKWLRDNDYTDKNTTIVLPHDGETHDRVYDVSYESAFNKAGYETVVITNQGKGAASLRIECGRRVFPSIHFDKEKTESGRKALGWYHEKWDETRNIGLGPDHDWSCLPAGEKIKTPNGYKNVEDFNAGDNVITCGKIGKVTRAQYVKNSIIIEITLKDRSKVRCTPEHKIFTRLGLVMAKDLKYNDVLLEESEVSEWLASSKGIRSAFIEHTRILGTTTGPKGLCMSARKMVNNLCFTGFGGLKVLKSITKILTLKITTALTLSRYQAKSIMKYTVLEEEPVWDIEVENDHAYTLYSSNIVTSNSHGADSFGLMCLDYEQQIKGAPEISDPYKAFRRHG